MKNKATNASINVQGTEISIIRREDEDYISLTDIAHHKNPNHSDDLIRNRLRNHNTVEFPGMWEHAIISLSHISH